MFIKNDIPPTESAKKESKNMGIGRGSRFPLFDFLGSVDFFDVVQ